MKQFDYSSVNSYPDSDAVSIYSTAWLEQNKVNPMKYPHLYGDEYLVSHGIDPNTVNALNMRNK